MKLVASRGRIAEQVETLVEATSRGDASAREELAKLCLNRIRRTVFLMHGPGEDGRDLVQAAAEKVFSRIDSFRGDSSFLVWVDRVTANVVKDHVRGRKIRLVFASDSPILENAVEQRADIGDQVDRYRLLAQIAEHLAAIKPKRRLPLVLSLLHGYTNPEIAVMLDISFNAAKKRLQGGRKILLKRLLRDPSCAAVLKEMGR